MPNVTNTIKYPNGTVAAGRVTIDLVGTNGRPLTDGAFVSGSDYAIEASYSADLDDGEWTASLVANALISPSGTRWRVKEHVNGQPTTYYVEVPDGAGPYFVEDILDEAPASVASSALSAHMVDDDAHGLIPVLSLLDGVSIRSYGAELDGQAVYDAAMTNASAVITSATGRFAVTDVGKVITVQGAGSSGRVLVSTIASFQSTTQVTAADAASATVSGRSCYWGTDDTEAWQDFLTDAAGSAGGDGGLMAYGTGISICAGDVEAASGWNSVLQVPKRSMTDRTIALGISGGLPGVKGHFVAPSATVPSPSGLILYCPTDNVGGLANGAFIATAPYADDYPDCSNVHFTLQNVTIRGTTNSNLIDLQLRGANCVQLDNVSVDIDCSTEDEVEPTNTNNIGILLPTNNNGGALGYQVNVTGKYTGIVVSEDQEIFGLNVLRCKQGILQDTTTNHETFLQGFISRCTTAVVITGRGYWDAHIGIEHDLDTGTWTQSTYDVDDASNLLNGRLWFSTVKAGFGPDNLIRVNGGTGFNAIPLTPERPQKVVRTAGNIAANDGSTNWHNLSTALDLTLGAKAGDWIEVGMAGLWSNEAPVAFIDAVSMASSSPVANWSKGTAEVNTTSGVLSWRGGASALSPISGSVVRQLTAADFDAGVGAVTIRFRVRLASAATKTLFATSDDCLIVWAKNLARP